MEVKIFTDGFFSSLEKTVNKFLKDRGRKIILKDIKYAVSEGKYSAMIIFEDNSSSIDDIL